MSRARTHTRSFAGGEIAPEEYGRVDLTKYQTGLRTCRNMLVLPHGPVTRRPGFEYVLQAKSTGTVRLIPFSFNTEQTYILELGYQYMRFHTAGATVLQVAQNLTSITNAYPVGVVTYTGADPANGTWVYLRGVSGMTEVNGRFVIVANVNPGAKTFELHDLFGNQIDTGVYSAGTGGTMQPVYEIATPYAEADLFDIRFTQSADVMTLVHPGYAPRTLSRLSGASFSLDVISFTPSIDPPSMTSATVSTAGTVAYSYVVTAIDEDNFEESIASGAADDTGNLTTAGAYTTVVWTAPTTGTPVRYNVYKAIDFAGGTDFGVYGYIGQTDGLLFHDNNITPDYSITPPIIDTPFAAADDYPAAVGYFEQRKVFANTNRKPQNYWLTRTGTEHNLYRSLPVLDNDAIRGRIVAQQVNEIRHFVALSDLLVLTVGGEWVMSGSGGSGVTPSSLSVRPQSYKGASKVMPEVTGNAVLYVQAAGSRVHEISYSWESSAFRSDDAAIHAAHLVDGYQVTQLAFEKTPDPILWAVRNDGTLLGMTYLPEQEVRAWHQHVTQGSFKSVAIIQEDSKYVPYVVVQRTINGATRNFVERLHERRFDALEDWFGVDSGLTYDGAEASTITGLWHLEGETVQVLGDGARLNDAQVINGQVALSTAASKVHLGLGYSPLVSLLPTSFSDPAGGQGRAKSDVKAFLRLNRTIAVQIGETEDTVHVYPGRTTEGYGSPPDLLSEEIDVTLNTGYSQDGALVVMPVGPLPLTLTAIVLEIDAGG